MSLKNLVVDLGVREFSFGLTYVALSRISDVETLTLSNFTLSRYLI